jgi:hypothetical protein
VVEDGSIRTVCSAREAPSREAEDARSFAFDGDGRSLAGWPVDLGQTNQLDESALYTGRMIGEELRLSVSTMSAYEFVRVTTITADGEIRRGADVALYRCCSEWAVGPDGIAYGVAPPSYVADGTAEVSQVTAIDLDGRRPGWPLTVDGLASGPVFGSGDRIALTIGSVGVGESHVITFDPRGTAISARSGALPITTAATSTRCQPVLPKPPIVARDGTHYVFGGVDAAIYALDPSLKVRSGWPFEPATPLERTGYDDPLTDYFCPSFGLPAVGPDSTLYLPLQARDGSVGGSIVAVGPDGRVRSGWPVELRKPGAAFWSIVVGADGTAFALAIEPETGGASSATILAIAPNSTVRYTTTVIEPE